MLPAPESAIRSIGATIRAARLARGLTQQRAAREAKVSRAQLALLERGGNVSIRFLLTVARYLELTNIPLDGTVQLTSGARDGLNVLELIQSLDLLAALVEHLRGFAIAAVLPPSERGRLDDTLALRDFVVKHVGDEAGVDRLAQAILRLSEDAPAGATPPRVRETEQQAESKRAKTSRRRSE